MGGGITRTFRPWTHTSEDSYIYQRSLVVVTATDVSFERSEFLIPTWVTPQYRATSKKKICACVRLILVLVGGRQTAIVVARYDSMIPGTYYVPDTNVPGISRQKSIRTYVMFRPWTHTSDDSYIYQLSLVVATATVFKLC